MAQCKIEDLKKFLPPKSRLFGLDVGSKTIGISLCDSDLRIASPLRTLIRGKMQADLKILYDLAEERQVGGFVVGLPRNMDGSESESAQMIRTFVHHLLHYKDVPVVLWDERLSTASMERHFIAQDVSRQKRAAIIDEHAAAFILQGALDRLAKAG